MRCLDSVGILSGNNIKSVFKHNRLWLGIYGVRIAECKT